MTTRPDVKVDRRSMALLSLAHVADDTNQSFLPAMLPLLIVTYHFSLQTAGMLVLGQAISSSVIQPAIGHLADRRSMPWLIAAGLLLAGGGVALVGFTSSFPVMFAAALVSGIGVAMFHPEAARFSNFVAGTRKATGMRWFSLGGNIGFATGPAYATLAIAAFAQRGTWLAFLPCLIMATLVFIDLPRLKTFQPVRRPLTGHGSAPDRWGAFGVLTGYVMLRATVYVGVIAFIPLFFINTLHASHAAGNFGMMLYLIFGALGTLAGGPLADRFGRRIVMVLSTAGTAVLLASFAFFTHSTIVGYLLISVAGFVLVASNVALVVLGQEYLPNRLGIASGVTLGIAVSVGGMMSPVLGAVGDRYGLGATFYVAAVFSGLAAIFGLWLPERQPRADSEIIGMLPTV